MADVKSNKPEATRLTGLKKRQQIAASGRTVFIWVAVAAAALSFCAVTVQYLFVKWQHNNDVLSAKYKAADVLTQSLNNAGGLTQNVNALEANSALASVKTNPSDSNTKSVLDALPTTFDPAALATSLQQVVLSQSGVSIENITVPQELQPGTTPNDPKPQPMPFSFIVSGSYDKVQRMVNDIERTIRPIKIDNITLSGNDSNLRVTVNATTYYQPIKSVTVKETVIK